MALNCPFHCLYTAGAAIELYVILAGSASTSSNRNCSQHCLVLPVLALNSLIYLLVLQVLAQNLPLYWLVLQVLAQNCSKLNFSSA
jgi:hypothetical protein